MTAYNSCRWDGFLLVAMLYCAYQIDRMWDNMSEYIVKVIPQKYDYHLESKRADCAATYLKEQLLAEHVEIESYPAPVFVDCGSNLEVIRCPHCSSEIDFAWWGGAMNGVSGNGFSDLSVITPCCQKESALNELTYHYHCGFASSEIRIVNPSELFSREHQTKIEELLGCSVAIIHAHM